jgi:hypothetical protein
MRSFRNLATNRPDLDPRRLLRTRDLMNLPDPDDRHVLAAAIKARAQGFSLTVIDGNLRNRRSAT